MRYAASLAAFACLTLPVLAEPFHHPSGEWRQHHRDWLAACPDAIDESADHYYGYSCFASTGSQALNGAGLPAYTLTLVRNRLDGVLDIAITVAPDQGGYDPDRPMTIRLPDTTPLVLSMGTDLETRFDTANQFFVIDPQARERLVEMIKERAALTLAVPLIDQEKPVEIGLSLQGAMAALDFMDTYARRVAQY